MNKEYSIAIDGKNVTFEFKDSLIHVEGDAVGNIDAIITTKPPLPQSLLLDELHIKVPGTNEYLYIYGYGAVENSLKATFNSSAIVDKQKLPEKVEIYWGANGEQFIGEMNCRPYSEKIESELSEEIIAPEEPKQTPETETSPEEEVSEKQDETNAVEKPSSNKKLILISIAILIIIVASFLLL
jgi:hypothetical protein